MTWILREVKLLPYSSRPFKRLAIMPNENKKKEDANLSVEAERGQVKFEVYGQEMVEKVVKLSGNSGRVYLPPDWVGSRVKIIRID